MTCSRLLRTVAGLALVGAMTGCSISLGDGGSGPSVVTSSTDASTSGAADAQALLGKMVPYPTGARPWTHSRTGAFGLNDFIDNFYQQAARVEELPLAQRRGFTGAARHGWFTADGSQAEVWLVDFAQTSGAQSMFLGLTDSWKQNTSAGPLYQDPVVHGTGQVNPTLDSLGDATVKEAAVVGRTLAYVIYFSAATPDKASAMALLKQQVAALNGS
jgi:hypothetical protein